MIRAIVEQHAEEAAALWLLRDAAVTSSHYDLPALAELDDRLDAHLDALRIAGRGGITICRRALALGEAGEVFALSVLAFGCGDQDGIDDAIDAASGSPELARGVVSALGWLPWKRVGSALGEMLERADPPARRMGIAAALAHRIDPGYALDASLLDSDTRLRARAIRGIGELGLSRRLNELRVEIYADTEEVRFWAAWSAALLGDRPAVRVLREVCERGGPHAERACSTAVRRMEAREAREWLRALAADPALRRIAVIGAGAHGDPADAPWLLDQMAAPELARIAGESFTMITGIDVHESRGAPPDDFSAGPTDDPEDEDVAMDPDAYLPWPDVAALRRRLAESPRPLAKNEGIRCLLGEPITPLWSACVLWSGTQRQRAAAAIELAMTGSWPLFEVRAPGFRQERAAPRKDERAGWARDVAAPRA